MCVLIFCDPAGRGSVVSMASPVVPFPLLQCGSDRVPLAGSFPAFCLFGQDCLQRDIKAQRPPRFRVNRVRPR